MTTSIRELLDAAGAEWGERFGRTQVLRFGDVAAEHAALRSGCGLLDASFRTFVRAVGDDRVAFLHGMVSNDVKARAPGEGMHAAILTVQGRVVCDLRLYVLDDEIWLDLPAHRRDTAVATLEKYIIADDVELLEPDVVPLLVLEGRAAASVFATAFAVDVADLQPCGHRPFAVDDRSLRVFAVTHSGEPGYLVVGRAEDGAFAWERARDAGATPVGAEALDIARVEAGIPLMDADMDEENLAPEVGLAEAISFKKGCYIGQEVVERVASRGNVQKRLMGLELDGAAAVPARTVLQAGGSDAGAVTSCVISPVLGTIALAYVRRVAWEPGSRVDVVGPDGATGATVVALPFVGAGVA